MPIKFKDVLIGSIEDTETKKLRVLKMASKEEGANLTLELPDALCEPFKVKDTISVTIDSEAILKGETAKFYAEGTVFKINESEGLEVVGTIGGLRFAFEVASPKPTQRKIFESEKFFLALT
ncbi:MAG: hypothetical protein ACFFDM_00280 [Candidatus Thorarchaeota archaeon]